jgi:hypothetical protein
MRPLELLHGLETVLTEEVEACSLSYAGLDMIIDEALRSCAFLLQEAGYEVTSEDDHYEDVVDQVLTETFDNYQASMATLQHLLIAYKRGVALPDDIVYSTVDRAVSEAQDQFEIVAKGIDAFIRSHLNDGTARMLNPCVFREERLFSDLEKSFPNRDSSRRILS